MKMVLVMGLVMGLGCAGLVPSDRTRSEAVKSSEAIAANHDVTIRRVFESAPALVRAAGEGGSARKRDAEGAEAQRAQREAPEDWLGTFGEVAPGIRMTEEVHEASGQASGSKDAAAGQSVVKISLAVKLAIGAVALVVLVIGWRMAAGYLKTTAVGQFAGLVDDRLSAVIRAQRAKAEAHPNAEVKAVLQEGIAAVEAVRGKNAGAS